MKKTQTITAAGQTQDTKRNSKEPWLVSKTIVSRALKKNSNIGEMG